MKKALIRGKQKGFTLLEMIVVLLVIAILVGGFGIAKYYSIIKQADATAIIGFIKKARQSWTLLQNNPMCNIPTDKTTFINEVSDSQCRSTTTDHKGNWTPPQKIDNRWNWDIQNNELIIQNVNSDIANKVLKIYPDCTYTSGNIECPLDSSPTAS